MKILELLLITMRPYRWWRVLVIFIPFIFSGTAGNMIVFLKLIMSFLIFSLLTGAINIIDDITDYESDKKDLVKSALPIASGQLSINKAEFSVGMILAASFTAAFLLGAVYGAFVVAYFAIELGYYLLLKKYEIVDALTIGAETSILLLAGGVASGLMVSPWLFVFSVGMSVLLVFCVKKRELILSSAASETPLSAVDRPGTGLDQAINITSSFVLIIYSFYTLLSFDNLYSNLVYTVPILMWVIYRVIMLTYDSSNDISLEKMLLKDRMLMISIAVWVVLTIFLASFK